MGQRCNLVELAVLLFMRHGLLWRQEAAAVDTTADAMGELCMGDANVAADTVWCWARYQAFLVAKASRACLCCREITNGRDAESVGACDVCLWCL